MTTRRRSGLAEALETCRPAPLDKPNILKTLLAVQSAMGHVPTSAIKMPVTAALSSSNTIV